tara:strand:+ start:1778 stop:2605 length:828 start_codon:yes stop_codon:yes gene_type:complete
MINNIGWKNHKWEEISRLEILISDRGLKFGDGLFETILIRNNKPILIDQHLKRFEKNLKILNFNIPINYNFLYTIIYEGIDKLKLNKKDYGCIRINYSRGINTNRSIQIQQVNTDFNINNLWIEFNHIEVNMASLSVHISETEKRNQFSLISQCKTFNYMQSIQAFIEAKNKNFDDSLLLNTSDELCCGTTFNILLKRDNQWFTPRKESGCLAGIMINKLLDLNLIKEAYLKPNFKKDDILIAINSLSCRQIKRVNNLNLISEFDTNYFWELLYQ